MPTKSKLVEAYRAFGYDVAAVRHFAEEPVYDSDGTPHAPSRVHVWVQRNLPTFVVLWANACMLAGMVICKVRGHAWVDNSYGGPESGCVDMHCTRCGHGHHVTLY